MGKVEEASKKLEEIDAEKEKKKISQEEHDKQSKTVLQSLTFKDSHCSGNCLNKICRKSVQTDREFIDKLAKYLDDSHVHREIAAYAFADLIKDHDQEDWSCDKVEDAISKYSLESDFEYGIPLEKSFEQEDGSLIIFGKASGGEEDFDGEIVDQGSLAKLFPQYMQNPVIKFMHGRDYIKHAIGVALEKWVDPKTQILYKSQFSSDGPYLVAKLSSSDDVAPIRKKVKEGILKGFSIGGKLEKKIKEFDKGAGKFTTRVIPKVWSETSVVDTPAYKKAFFQVITKATGSDAPEGEVGKKQPITRIGIKRKAQTKIKEQKMSEEDDPGQGASDTLKQTNEKLDLIMKVIKLETKIEKWFESCHTGNTKLKSKEKKNKRLK